MTSMNSSPSLQTGLKPFVPSTSDALFADFRVAATMPTIPGAFGDSNLLPTDIGMFANDRLGICAPAEAAHASMLLSQVGGHPMAKFTDAEVIALYSAVTGYNPSDPNSDQGTDYRVLLSYLRKTGIKDDSGKAHKIGAFVLLEAGNTTELDEALFLFKNVPIGLDLPGSAQDQFAAGHAWDVVKGAKIDGGHAVGGVQKVSEDLYLLTTWGRKWPTTKRFIQKYMTQGWGTVSPEALKSGKSENGYDTVQLDAFIKAL